LSVDEASLVRMAKQAMSQCIGGAARKNQALLQAAQNATIEFGPL